MFLHVTKVKYIRDYRLWLRFDNDKEGFINLEKHLWGEVFEPLKDKEYFSQVYLNPDTGTTEWPNEADFAPEFLLENLEPEDAPLQAEIEVTPIAVTV